MAWTQSDIDALKAAMAKGVRTVTYTDGSVTYHSLSEMKQLLADMQRDVTPDANPRRRVGQYDRGF